MVCKVGVDELARQLKLDFQEHTGGGIGGNGSGFSDPAFASNKSLPIHRWVPWIAGFSSDFVRDAINRHLHGSGVILDPFAGVGTTLVEAGLLGYDSVGFEINPFAALACRVKTNASMIQVEEMQAEIPRFQSFYMANNTCTYKPMRKPPQGFSTRAQFYSPAVLHKVLVLWDFMDSLESQQMLDLFRLAFASTMISYSNYSYEPSLGRRTSAGKGEIQDFPVGEKVFAKLREMLDDITWVQSREVGRDTTTRIVSDSFFKYRDHLSPSSVDLVVTSPPYLNNYHYNRNTRPQLYWLGYINSPGDMRPLEESNFGKYWQTVREHKRTPLEFTLPGTDMEEKLEVLRRHNPDRGVYGGNGWANYAAAYFNDCLKLAEGIKYLLRPGAAALVVIGNSILQGLLIPTDEYFGKIAEHVGLELVGIHVPRTTRTGNSIIQSDVRAGKAGERCRLYEAVVEVRNTPAANRRTA